MSSSAWTVDDAERLLIALSRFSYVSDGTIEIAYDELRHRSPDLPEWESFLELLTQSRFHDFAAAIKTHPAG